MSFVIVNIKGGIGNQLFQYAVGRGLSHHLGSNLLLDLTYFRHSGSRHYDLDKFSISGHPLGNFFRNAITVMKREIFCSIPNPMSVLLRLGLQVYKERSLSYDRAIFDVQRNVYLDGYWQSEKYFAQIREIIRSELSLKETPDHINSAWLMEIASNCSVSIHVRRGDYVTDPTNLRIYERCSLDYYQRAVRFLCERLDSPTFYIFSDDPVWTASNLKIEASCSYVFHNHKRSPLEDFRLMSMCKHHIIANSTFSWWAAWLSTHFDKLVVAPRRWFAAKDMSSSDLIPETWVTL